jgi:hypothetical protein
MGNVVPLTGRERAKAFRERQRDGLIILKITAPETRVVNGLIEARLLDPLKADDHGAIEEAAGRALEILWGIER